jgi:group I intron endonuclease
MNVSGIYIIKNEINNKFYIGSSVNIKKRWRDHRWRLRNNKHHSPYFQNSWNAYGEESFTIEVLEECPVTDLLKREQFYIDEYTPEYNVSKTAGNRLGCKHSDETKKKIGDKHKGKTLTDASKRKISETRKGKPICEATRRALLAANIGRNHSEETKRKIGIANAGKPNAKKGTFLSEHTKEAIRKANTGKRHSDDAKRKISEAKKGKTPMNKVFVSEVVEAEILRNKFDGKFLKDIADVVGLSVDVVRRVLRDHKKKNG